MIVNESAIYMFVNDYKLTVNDILSVSGKQGAFLHVTLKHSIITLAMSVASLLFPL